MRTGVVLPTFSKSPEGALAIAARAEALGVDGVFCYDHLWPMGSPERPALAPFPILAALAVRHPKLFIGPLVARIGLVDDEVLLAQFRTLAALSPGKVIAALGTGDSLSKRENEAYGIAFDPPAERRSHLRRCAEALDHEGLEVWIGGGARATVQLAESLGCAVNLWGASPEQVAEQARRSPVTWAGVAPTPGAARSAGAPEELMAMLAQLAEAGATWAVLGWPVSLEVLAEASRETER
jgi:alkanesulfonate monooxygenase SsuD/methylene tetrahydromethanopterin reductase-like flavin-dependent oxidoreductase (luciferase family)